MSLPASVRRLRLTRIDLVPGCTTGVGVGLESTGNEVTFTADWRTCLDAAETLQAGQAVEVFLHDGQVICWDSGGRRS